MNVSLISVDNNKAATGIRSLSSYLKQYNINTKLILLRSGYKVSNKKVLKNLKGLVSDSDLIGISSMTPYYPIAVQLKDYLKGLSLPIVLGGIHATVDTENCLKDFSIICIGEGEEAFTELVISLREGRPIKHIPNIYLQEDGYTFKNAPRPLIKTLGCLPFPDYDTKQQYIQKGDEILPITKKEDIEEAFVVMGSRGCPHNCSYCCNSKIQQIYNLGSYEKMRFNSIDYLLKHLKYALTEFPYINKFWIADDTFFYRTFDEIDNFSSRYIKEINKPFLMLCSPETFNEKKLQVLLETGMDKLILGIQSGSSYINKVIYNRFYDRQKILEIANCLNKNKKLNVYYDFIGLNPYERENDILSSIKLIKDLPTPFTAYINSLAFYPGTTLYEKAKKDGLDMFNRERFIDEFVLFRNLLRLKSNKYLHFIFINLWGYHNKERSGFFQKRHLNILLSERFIKYAKFFRIILDVIINLYCLAEIFHRKYLQQRQKFWEFLPLNLRMRLKLFLRGSHERVTLA